MGFFPDLETPKKEKKMEKKMKYEVYCRECDGTNVRSLYWLEWNIEKDEWDQGSFDDVESFMDYCDDCDNETKIKDREISH